MNAHELLEQKYLTLTCLGADGLPTQASVFFVPEGDGIVTVVTAAQADALAGCVTVAACSARGRRIGMDFFADVSRLTPAETTAVITRLIGRYGVVPRNLTAHRDDLVGLRVRPVATRCGHTLNLAA